MNYYEHPDDVQSMKGLAEILRGEGPHSVLVVLSMLALMMYPVACLVCPHNDSRADTNELLRASGRYAINEGPCRNLMRRRSSLCARGSTNVGLDDVSCSLLGMSP